ncbi:hypothetical protein NQZ68_008206 [Dissostichus eleginoides]|nr:hypothetical protein NQZ68_008206 [Dissostichus eleginoides]
MRVTSSLLLASLFLILLPYAEMKRPGKGRGLKGARHKLTRNRVRGVGRHSRSGPSRISAPQCSELTESGDFFVDCQDRGLSSIPASQWSKQPNHLLLARNRIKILRDGALLGFESLTSLDLQQNHISLVAEGAFQGLTRLTTLLLQHNRLGTLSEEALISMPNLRYLRLHDNPWNCVCPMESLIRTLQVPSNRNLGNHARCAEPSRLKGMKLRQIDPEFLCKEKTDPTGKPQGDQTYPTNAVQPIPIRTKPDATTSCHTYLFPQVLMDCSKRGLTEVPTGIPEDVVHIDMSHNSIRHLKARDFQGARSLRSLNISHNNMEHIDTGSLSGLLHLRELDLSDNSLHSVQYGVLEDLYFLLQLKLGGNPWVCDYSIQYMMYWLRLHPGVRYSGMLCRSPPEHTGESVAEYVRSYNRACPKDRQHSRTDPDQTDPELWNTAMEVQGELEEELEPSHLRTPQKYQIIRLS